MQLSLCFSSCKASAVRPQAVLLKLMLVVKSRAQRKQKYTF